MKDWKAELDDYFRGRDQQEKQHPDGQSRPTGETTTVEEFMAAVATPAFEEFGAVLREHGCHVRLRLGDSNMRVVSEYAGKEEFDYTLWAGKDTLSVELRSDGRRSPESFQNAKGNSTMDDTTQNDIAQHLADKYVALVSPMPA